MKIVSLTCSNTEIVCALGCSELLVGVDDHSDYPASVVGALPRVGPDLGIRIPLVEALEPDLVLASLTVPGHEKVVEGLERAGLPHIAPAPVSVQDTYRDIREISARIGVSERGEQLVAEMQAAMPRIAPRGPRPRVGVEWWPKPVIVPGRKSWVTDLIEWVGGENPWGQEECESLSVEVDDARNRDPQAMVISWCGVATEKYRPQQVYGRPGWESVAAVRDRQVHGIAEAYLGRPGPRLVQGYQALKAVVDALAESDQSRK